VRNDMEVKCILISVKAGGIGLNLTACNNVILLEPWWNPAVEEQAFDCVHRIGQLLPVNIYKLVVQDSVEERMLE
ncbi:P-loop containing nucleoside triphosphate hydrolase protein, partial [Pisolithus marmoratus]